MGLLRLHALWMKHRTAALRVVIVLLALYGAAKLGDESYRLTLRPDAMGAIDLKLRYVEVHEWFAGHPVYGRFISAVYPPATCAILWPLVGWMSLGAERWFWCDPRGNWGRDAVAAALITLALAKPSLAAPFWWIALFAPGRLRPALLVVLLYGLLTVGAARFQEAGLIELLRQWLNYAPGHVAEQGYADLHKWLTALGFESYALPASLIVLVGTGLWAHRYRRADLWLQLAVVALIARLWTYHRQYDNLLLLPAMIILFRQTGDPAGVERQTVAGLLLAMLLAALLLPARLLEAWPAPWPLLVSAIHTVLFLTTLGYLLYLVQTLPRRDFSLAGP